MQIEPKQVASETRIDEKSPLFTLLTGLGAKKPKVVLVFDSNENGSDEAKYKWKVHVFYHAPAALSEANLDVDTVLVDTQIKAVKDEIIRTIYPGGYIGWCGVINGQQIWIT